MTTTRRIDDVKKALACCIVRDPDDKMRCTECPYRDPGTYCLNRLKTDALETIEMLDAALEAVTGDDCETCEIEGVGENENE